MKQKPIYIILSVTILTALMNFVDAVIKPVYAVKSTVKVILFLLIPIMYFVKNKEEIAVLKSMFTINKKGLFSSLILGISLYVFIVGGYFIVKGFVDFSSITGNLENIGVNENNFIFVSLYIALFNSFLEEFFFRGFSFLSLKNHTGQIVSYAFSSFMFAAYHMGMTFGWVHPIVFILEISGLMAGGIVFNYLNDRTGSLYPSWITHMFCNFGINTVGFMLFSVV